MASPARLTQAAQVDCQQARAAGLGFLAQMQAAQAAQRELQSTETALSRSRKDRATLEGHR